MSSSDFLTYDCKTFLILEIITSQNPLEKFLEKRSLKISFIITFHDFVNFKSKSIINGIRD